MVDLIISAKFIVDKIEKLRRTQIWF